MDGDALREHFIAGTRQEVCPFGDDAVEWDYSRYSRALGLTDEIGLHEIPHTGAAVVGVPPSRWPGLAADYREWCEAARWRFVFVSGRPSVLVPDGIAYGVGDAIAGADSMLFARSGNGGRPALGRRPRAAGMSIPLTSGERWLIATDRVRRRVRSASAQEGLLLFIEEAQCVSAAAMNMLSHWLDAHRAWKARMLSRDARLYFVLVTTPERQGGLVRMFERYASLGNVLCVRSEDRDSPDERRRNVRARARLSAEDEHLLAALGASPLALEARDLALLFGTSAVGRAEELAQADLLRRRIEYGRTVFAANPAHLDGLPPPPERVLRGLLARLRRRAHGGRGHGHVHAAMASLAFRLGEPLRALACLGRMGHADDAVVPLDLLEDLDGRLGQLVDPPPHEEMRGEPGPCTCDEGASPNASGGAAGGGSPEIAASPERLRGGTTRPETESPDAGVTIAEGARASRGSAPGAPHAVPVLVSATAPAAAPAPASAPGSAPRSPDRDDRASADATGGHAASAATPGQSDRHAPTPHRMDEPSARTRRQPRLRAATIASWIAWHAHQRNYARAKHLIQVLARVPHRGEADLYGTLTHILCTGRTHLDQTLPEGFWATLSAPTIDPALLDTVCILADLFARIRLMTDKEILERFEVVEGVFESLFQSPGRGRIASPHGDSLFKLATVMHLRVSTHVHAHLRREALTLPTGHRPASTLGVPNAVMVPAYCQATAMYAEILGGVACDSPTNEQPALSLTLTLIGATGNPRDAHAQLACMFQTMATRGLRLLLRHSADDLVLLLPSCAQEQLRQRVSSTLQVMSCGRTWRLSAARLFLARQAAGHSISTYGHSATALGLVLLTAGDLVGARDAMRLGRGAAERSAVNSAFHLLLRALFARKLLDGRDIAALRASLSLTGGLLPSREGTFLRHFVAGTEAVIRRQFALASDEYWTAAHVFRGAAHGPQWTMRSSAIISAIKCDRLQALSLSAADREQGTHGAGSVTKTIRALVSHDSGPVLALSYETDALMHNLEWLILGLEQHARSSSSVSGDNLLTWIVCLKRYVDPGLQSVGTSLMSMLRRHAPRLFASISEQLRGTLGGLMPAAPIDCAAGSGVESLKGVVDERTCAALVERARGDNRVALMIARGAGLSRRRLAQRVNQRWFDDAAVFSQLTRLLHHEGERGLDTPLGVLAYTWSRPSHKEVSGPVLSSITVDSRGCLELKARGSSRGTMEVRRGSPHGELVHREQSAPLVLRRARQVGRSPLEFTGTSPAATEIREMIEIAAACDHPVLILGETGTGKELVARAIHAKSRRGRSAITVLDPASCVESLLESVLFGHVKGSFTGATASHDGLFAQAHHSTLLLDEIASLPLRVQCTLLRVIESGEYRSVGSSHSTWSDFRLLSSGPPTLPSLIGAGAFRSDLYYRISTLTIAIPPLRERPGDAVEIARRWARRHGATIGDCAFAFIDQNPWPGNVRELLAALRVASAHSKTSVIDAGALAHSPARHTALIGGRQWPLLPGPQEIERLEAALDRGQAFTVNDVCAAMKMSRRSAQRFLSRLCGLSALRRYGAARGTRYMFADAPEGQSGVT